MIDITPIILSLGGIIIAIVACVIIPVAIQKYGADKVANVQFWISVAVSAAEQIFSAYEGKHGAEKKSYVLEFLEKHGITYDAEKIDAMIEAEVLKLKSWGNTNS